MLRGVEQGRARDEGYRGAAGGDGGAAAARVEAGVEDPPVGAVRVDREGDADQIAARGAAGSAGVGVRGRVAPSQAAVRDGC